MANPIRQPAELDPRGPEGVPVDAPDNTAPAISPHTVSRTHRAEDDRTAHEHSPEYSDHRNEHIEDRRPQERWLPGAPGSGDATDVSHGLDSEDTKGGRVNPGHHTHKDPSASPRGRGDGELQEQPRSTEEAQQPGVDNPQFDE
jgi:hypothetical protein